MSLASETAIREFLWRNRLTQAELALGIGKTSAFVSNLVCGKSGASQQTIEATLSFLCRRLGRVVSYEEVFGRPAGVTSLTLPAGPGGEAA